MAMAGRKNVAAAYAHDPIGREQLIVQNLPLVHHIIGKLAIGFPSVFDREDLVAHGVIGLIQAIDRFDPSQGVPFGAWASIRIRGAVLDAIRSLDIMSPSARQRVRVLQATTNQLTALLGRFPTDDEVQSAMGLSPEDYATVLEAAGCQIVSLDAATAEEGSPLSELIQSKTSVDPSERGALLAMLGEALRQLDERERLVLAMYYVEDLTLQEIAHVIGVHKTVVVRNHSRAIIKLRTLLDVNEDRQSLPREDTDGENNHSKIDNVTPFPSERRGVHSNSGDSAGPGANSGSRARGRYAGAGGAELSRRRLDLGSEDGERRR